MTAPRPAPGGLKHRRDFLAAAKARKAVSGSFILQARDRQDGDEVIRVGFTASKKVGNAVARNRAKRRLRAMAWEVIPSRGRAGHDYVLIARRDATADAPFAQLRSELERALDKLGTR